jgi:hypothetical protein
MNEDNEHPRPLLENLTADDLARLQAAGLVDNTREHWESVLSRAPDDPIRAAVEDILLEISSRHPVRWDLMF